VQFSVKFKSTQMFTQYYWLNILSQDFEVDAWYHNDDITSFVVNRSIPDEDTLRMIWWVVSLETMQVTLPPRSLPWPTILPPLDD